MDEEEQFDEYTLHSMSTRRRIPKNAGEDPDVMAGFGRHGYPGSPLAPEAGADVAGSEEPSSPTRVKSPPRIHSPPPEAFDRSSPIKQRHPVALEPLPWLVINWFLTILRFTLLTVIAIPMFFYVFDAHMKQFFRSLWLGVSSKAPHFSDARPYDLGKLLRLMLVSGIVVVAVFGPQAPTGGGITSDQIDQLQREIGSLKNGQKSLNELQTAFSGLQSKVTTDHGKLEEVNKKLGGEQNTLKGEHKTLKGAHDKLSDAHEALEAQHAATAKQLASTKQELDKALQTLAELQKSLSNYASQSELKKLIDGVSNEITVIKAAQPASTSGDATPSAALTQLLQKMTELEEKYIQYTDSQELKLQELNKAVQGHAKSQSALEKQLEDAKSDLAGQIASIPQLSVDGIVDQVKSKLHSGMSREDVISTIREQLESDELRVALYDNTYRAKVADQLKSQIDPAVKNLEQQIRQISQQQSHQPTQTVSAGNLDHSALVQLIHREIETHPLDGVEKADWASPHIGGVVVDAPKPDTTKHIMPGASSMTLTMTRLATAVGIRSDKWDKQSMIAPMSVPGSCYPLDSLPANVTIKLATSVIVDSVTIDHIHRQINWNEQISAPKEVSIYGHTSSHAVVHLGKVVYDINNPKPFQTFDVTNYQETPFNLVTFQIESTWGSDFACIYRLRVHGRELSGHISRKTAASATQSA